MFLLHENEYFLISKSYDYIYLIHLMKIDVFHFLKNKFVQKNMIEFDLKNVLNLIFLHILNL